MLTLREIGEMFDIDYVSVSSSARRFERDIKKNKELLNMKNYVISSSEIYA